MRRELEIAKQTQIKPTFHYLVLPEFFEYLCSLCDQRLGTKVVSPDLVIVECTSSSCLFKLRNRSDRGDELEHKEVRR